MRHDFRRGSDDLLVGRERERLLEFEITKGSGKGKVAVYSAKLDKSTSSCDSGCFLCRRSVDLTRVARMI
jgi:hypothetical protein